MRESIPFFKFMQLIFDDPNHAKYAAQIAQAILKARSIRMTHIAAFMPSKMEAAYKRITRFLKRCDPREALWKLFDQKAKFVIADPTPIPRPHAKKTDYVGTLNDGKKQEVSGYLSLPPLTKAELSHFI